MWCVAELDEEYIARMEEVLAVYEKPFSSRNRWFVWTRNRWCFTKRFVLRWP